MKEQRLAYKDEKLQNIIHGGKSTQIWFYLPGRTP